MKTLSRLQIASYLLMFVITAIGFATEHEDKYQLQFSATFAIYLTLFSWRLQACSYLKDKKWVQIGFTIQQVISAISMLYVCFLARTIEPNIILKGFYHLFATGLLLVLALEFLEKFAWVKSRVTPEESNRPK